MALSIQDFVKGVDFTALAEVADTDLNNLVDLSTPVDDLTGEGKGLILVTADAALDTPTVPDASVVEKWQRYVWLRKLHADATDAIPIVYGWDDNVTSDIVYKKWIRLFPDVDEFTDDLEAMQAQLDSVESIANAASANANAANALASTANNNSTAALAQIDSITTISEEALATANQTAVDLTTLETTVTEQLTEAAAKKTVDNALIPGLALQEIRTKAGATGVEWFNRKDTFIILHETKALNTDCGASVTGENLRDLNEEVYNNGATVLSGPADGMFTLPIGVYYIEAVVPAYGDNKGHQACLQKEDDTTLLSGTSVFLAAGGNESAASHIKGIITLTVATKCKLVDFWSAGEDDHGLGKAANVHPDGGDEVYSTILIQKIG